VDLARASRRTIRTPLVPRVLAYAERHGLDVGALLRAHGLAPLAHKQPAVAVTPSVLRALCDDVAEQLDDPNFGLHVALDPHRGTYGVAEFALRSAPTVREALGRAIRYQRLVNDLVQLQLRPGEGSSILVERFPGEPLAGGRHANAYAVAIVVVLGREISERTWPVRRVWLADPDAGDVTELAQFLGTDRIECGVGYNAIELADDVLDLPVASADPALLEVMDRVAPLLAPTIPGEGINTRARSEVRTILGKHAPTLTAVAQRLGLSSRTLQRSLADANTGFQEVVDGARQEVVMGLLLHTSLSLDEIAARAGYGDVRALKRAFRRWTGSTPSRWKSRQA
jgi:AraC-like DNA-binding protein